MRLKEKSVVVTGASSGMGRAIVELFVKEGANVIAAARRRERLEELAASLEGKGGRVLVCPADVSKLEDNEAMIDMAVKEFGRLDVLVNNAGIMDDMSPIGEVSDEKYEQVMRVNLYGPLCSMRKAVQVFLEQKSGGSIINVASVGALRSVAGAVYCASKAALVSMSKNTAFMYMNEGIRCNVIAPGGIETEIASSMGMPNMTGYSRVKKILDAAPAQGSAEDIARAALFLAGDESKYVSGDLMVVDGGWIAG
ncbi:MAG: glucose 1-dehydrogenase [Oscillospiraceae bacterium]|nr:glucose 1-dehydrogenase [Oscillospiraceae bacterium]